MMKKAAVAVLSLAFAANAATRVAVLEFGKRSTVRRTTSKNPETSAQGVASFWNALHNDGQQRRKLQNAGMTVVPDMFQQPYAGVVIGLTGSNIDLEMLPTVSMFVSDEGVVGVMDVKDADCSDLMENVKDVESTTSLKATALEHVEKKGLSGVKVSVDSSNAAAVDQEISDLMLEFQRIAEENDASYVVHIVVDEDESTFRQRQLVHKSRRLEEADANNAEDDNANGGSQYSGYYGYGYYNAYGEWVTPYRTMFQIQYFNVVLWTAVGLLTGLIFCIYLMVFMPLEPDTLLFGESAKLVGAYD